MSATAWLPPLVILAAGLLAYANSFTGQFLLDDHPNITEAPSLRSFAGVLSAPRPLVALSLRLNYALGRYTVEGYHAVNLAIHLLAGLALYGLVRHTLRRLPPDQSARAAARGLALAVALLLVVHPLQTQAFTYIIQRTEALMGLFYLLTLYCLVAGAEASTPRGRFLWYGGAVLCCALGMLSKEVMVTAPLLALLYDRVYLASSWREVVRRRFPLYLGLAASWLLLAQPLRWAFATNDPNTTAGFGLAAITVAEYARTQPSILLHYLRLVFWPHPLCLDYGWPIAQTASEIVAPALVVAALVALTAWALWRRPWLGFWGAWFFVILAPTSSLMPIADLAFEHRMYLPLAGVLVLAVLAVHAGLNALGRRAGWSAAALRARQIALVGLIGGLCTVLTLLRNEDYGSELAMWNNVLLQYPQNARAHYNLGRALYWAEMPEEADAEFRAALRLRPDDPRLHFGYGFVLFEQGRLAEAATQFREVLRLNPRSEEAANYLEEIRLKRRGS
jgi:protein O-mannosyl-transferase